jgi:acyl dehydratase
MYFDDFEIGQRFQCEPAMITAEEIEYFARKYDAQPIHIDQDFAESTMFEGVIASGFHTLSVIWGQWIKLNKFGHEIIVGTGMGHVTWTAPVRAGDQLTTEVEVIELKPSSKKDRGKITLKFSVTNQLGEVVLLTQGNALLKRKNIDRL